MSSSFSSLSPSVFLCVFREASCMHTCTDHSLDELAGWPCVSGRIRPPIHGRSYEYVSTCRYWVSSLPIQVAVGLVLGIGLGI